MSKWDDDTTFAVLNIAKLMSKWSFIVYFLAVILMYIIYSFFGSNLLSLVCISLIVPLAAIIKSTLQYPSLKIPIEFDFRSGILVLRSFNDVRIKEGGYMSAGFGPLKKRNYIKDIGQYTWQFSRVITIKKEDDLNSLYLKDNRGVIVNTDNDSWENDFISIAKRVSGIVLFLSNTDGVKKEMNLIVKNKLLYKTLIFMPETPSKIKRLLLPISIINYEPLWNDLRLELNEIGYLLPEYNPRGMFYIPTNSFSIEKKILFKDDWSYWKMLPHIFRKENPFISYLSDCVPREKTIEAYKTNNN